MNNLRVRLIVIFTLGAMFITNAQAYGLEKYRLKENLTYIPYSGFSSASIEQFNDALYTWNKELPDGPKMKRSTKTHDSSPEVIEKDGKNFIYRLPEFDSNSNYVAANRIVSKSDGLGKTKRVVESDINFDVNKKFANSGKTGCYDVQTVFLHEAGHTLGLKDIKSPTKAVMYYKATTGKERRSLSADDKNGLSDAYDLD